VTVRRVIELFSVVCCWG